jgi:hypothetical protein
MFFAFESLPVPIIGLSFVTGFVAGMLIYPFLRVNRE